MKLLRQRRGIDDLKEELRRNIMAKYPGIRLSFEPIELTEKIMAQGASTPIEVRVAGKNMEDIESYADRLVTNEAMPSPEWRTMVFMFSPV